MKLTNILLLLAMFNLPTALAHDVKSPTDPAQIAIFDITSAAAYVWPTGLDPATVGFGQDSGILALAITAHPDFDAQAAFSPFESASRIGEIRMTAPRPL